MENIKAKISFYFVGDSKPFASAEDYETLKKMLYIDSISNDETIIEKVIVENEPRWR